MRLNVMIRALVGAGIVFLLSGCATIVNDANIPLTFSFSDGSGGDCTFKNKRGTWESAIPTSGVYIRRSDDALMYDCKTRDGREATGSVRSEMEGGKLAASVLFWDLGITDAITDKHRTYQGNVVIPVQPIEAVGAKEKVTIAETPDSIEYKQILEKGVTTMEDVRLELGSPGDEETPESGYTYWGYFYESVPQKLVLQFNKDSILSDYINKNL